MSKVFISYARQDSELVGAAVVRPLKSHGIDVWIDQSQIRVGENWEQQIRANLEACNWFLVALSPNSVPPRQLNKDVPKELEVICMRCLSKRPSDRQETAEDFSNALREYFLKPKGMKPWYWPFSR